MLKTERTRRPSSRIAARQGKRPVCRPCHYLFGSSIVNVALSRYCKAWDLDALNGAVSEPAWRSNPSWYLVSTDDKMIPPDAQRAMSKRAGSTAVEVKGSHAVFVSQPRAVADLIAKAANGVAFETRYRTTNNRGSKRVTSDRGWRLDVARRNAHNLMCSRVRRGHDAYAWRMHHAKWPVFLKKLP
jgi:hypothetical protein